MRILWMSDSPTTPSGFGNVTRHVCGGLAARGHEVFILGWQAHGAAVAWQDCTVLPSGRAPLGADILLQHLQRHRPEVLITLADVWWLAFIADYAIARFLYMARIPWVMYYPIDSDLGGGRLPASWVRMLRAADFPVAMSRYGAQVTQANGVAADCIAHGVDTAIFKPALDRESAKRALGYGGRFVVLSDARNQPRKLVPRTLDIFRRFAATQPQALLHLHTDPDDPAAATREYNYNLRADIAALGLQEQVRITQGMSIQKGIPLEALAGIYQAADVHLLSSSGEGFGLPTLQAAAAGLVPMAADYTASRELTQGHGESIRVARFLSDEFGLQRALIDIDDARAKLNALCTDGDLCRRKQEESRRFALAYDWPLIVDQWDAFLGRTKSRYQPQFRGSGTVIAPSLMSSVLTGLPNGAQAQVQFVQRNPGQHAADVMEGARPDRVLTLPLTLQSSLPELAPMRRTGWVYLASQADLDVFFACRRIFPGLQGWSTRALAVGPAGADRATAAVQQIPSVERRKQLAASVLALDLGGTEPDLPDLACTAGVPCLPDSDSNLDSSDQAALLARLRTVLTDVGENEAMCAAARERLRGDQRMRRWA